MSDTSVRPVGVYWTRWKRARRDEPQVREWNGESWDSIGTWHQLKDCDVLVLSVMLQEPVDER